MKSMISWAVLICLAVGVSAFGAEAPSDLPQVALTIGAQGGEGEFEAYTDALIPVYLGENGLWLVNPRISASDNDEEEANLGLVYRHLFGEKNIIVGGNIYYDSRWTQHDNHFNQLGLGLEILTEWVDARANLYLPEDDEELVDEFNYQTVDRSSYTHWYEPYATGHEIEQKGFTRTTTTTTTYHYERYEQARQGWDAEVGVKLPGLDDYAEVRVFGGYYSWDNEYTERDEIEGWKGRLEARIRPIFLLDASVYEDKELSGTDWYVGGRVNLPFDAQALASGHNPFDGALDAARMRENRFADRLFEMVIRDLKIQTETSDYEEITQERVVDVDVDQKNYQDTLASDVMFVDDDADNDPGPDDPTISDPDEDGSASHPYDEIQEGVDNANSPVFVFEGEYNENVVVNKDVEIIGAGHPIGNGGIPLGGDFPVVNGWDAGGNLLDPTFFIDGNAGANDVAIMGLEILNSENGLYDPAADIRLMAVRADNVENFAFHHNRVRDAAVGLAVRNDAASPIFDHDIHDNSFYRLGLGIAAAGQNSEGRFAIHNNVISEVGVGVLAGAYDDGVNGRAMVELDITENTILSGGIGPVLGIAENFFGPLGVAGALPLPDTFPSIGGVAVVSIGLSTVDANISRNQITDNLLGIGAMAWGAPAEEARLTLNITQNDINGGGTAAVLDYFNIPGSFPAPFDTLPIGNIDLSIGGIVAIAADNSDVQARISDNTVRDQLLGVGAVAWGPGSQMGLDIQNNTIDDALIGAAVVGGDQARMGLAFNNNVVGGGGLDPLLDFGLAGLVVVAYDDTYINDVAINNNTFGDYILGVGVAAADGDSRMNDAEIGGNNIDAVLGFYGGAYGPGARMNNMSIHDNVIGAANLGIDLGPVLGGGDIDLGLAGILMTGTDDARVNNLTIDNNTINNHLIGAAVVGIGGVKHNNLTITDNNINNALLGVLALSEGNGADMDNLNISGNNITGGAGPLGILPDDLGVAGIVAVGWNEPTIRDAMIVDNNVSDMLLGVGVVGFDDVNFNRLEIGNNNLNNTAIGIVGAFIDGSSANDLWIHDNNLSAMDLLGGSGIAGIVALGATDVNMNNVDISDNNMSDYLLGTAVAGIGNVDLDNANISDNNIQNSTIGILGFMEGAGSTFRNVTVNDNNITGADQIGLLDGGLAGIAMIGWNEPNMRFMEITGNNISDTLLGIGAVGIDDVNLNDLEIGNNDLDQVGIGAIAGVIGPNSTMNDLWIHDNQYFGNNQGLLNGLGFEHAGLAGVVAFAVDDARANRFIIDDNDIDNAMLGVGVVSIGGGIMNNGQISDNTIPDSLIGVLALAEGNGAEMRNLDIYGNVIDGQYLGNIAELIDPTFDMPENPGLAGILVAGWNEPNMNGGDIHDNTVNDMAMGIGLIAYDDVLMNNMTITDNTIQNPVVGIGAASILGSTMDVDIADNTLDIGAGYDYGDVPVFLDTMWNTIVGGPLLPSAAPVGILAIGAGPGTGTFTIQDNTLTGFDSGIFGASIFGDDIIIGGNDGNVDNYYTGLLGDLTDVGDNLVGGVATPVITFP